MLNVQHGFSLNFIFWMTLRHVGVLVQQKPLKISCTLDITREARQACIFLDLASTDRGIYGNFGGK